MTYPVRLLLDQEDGTYAVWCPGLPGCWSQGATEEEALANIKDAIRDYVAVQQELQGPEGSVLKLVEVDRVA
jgi:predicted RNase H-like HicB family nuclease